MELEKRFEEQAPRVPAAAAFPRGAASREACEEITRERASTISGRLDTRGRTVITPRGFPLYL